MENKSSLCRKLYDSHHLKRRPPHLLNVLVDGENGERDDPNLLNIVTHHGMGLATRGLPIGKDGACVKMDRTGELHKFEMYSFPSKHK